MPPTFPRFTPDFVDLVTQVPPEGPRRLAGEYRTTQERIGVIHPDMWRHLAEVQGELRALAGTPVTVNMTVTPEAAEGPAPDMEAQRAAWYAEVRQRAAQHRIDAIADGVRMHQELLAVQMHHTEEECKEMPVVPHISHPALEAYSGPHRWATVATGARGFMDKGREVIRVAAMQFHEAHSVGPARRPKTHVPFGAIYVRHYAYEGSDKGLKLPAPALPQGFVRLALPYWLPSADVWWMDPILPVVPDGSIHVFLTPEHMLKNRRTALRPVRWLQTYAHARLDFRPDYPIAQALIGETTVAVLHYAKSQEEVRDIYENGPRSCMGGKGPTTGTHHPAEAYFSPDLTVAYLKHENRITARAVVAPKLKLFGRIYGDGVRLSRLLQADGYNQAQGEILGVRLRKIEHKAPKGLRSKHERKGFYLPYTDICTFVEDRGDPEFFYTIDGRHHNKPHTLLPTKSTSIVLWFYPCAGCGKMIAPGWERQDPKTQEIVCMDCRTTDMDEPLQTREPAPELVGFENEDADDLDDDF